MAKTGLALNTNHGLWSWAARHACWLLNKFQASKGITSHELVHGKTYNGALVPFGCPMYAFVKPQSGKGNPRWRMTLFLGKWPGSVAGSCPAVVLWPLATLIGRAPEPNRTPAKEAGSRPGPFHCVDRCGTSDNVAVGRIGHCRQFFLNMANSWRGVWPNR